MNTILEEKYNQLKAASDYECWYLVKQPTAFDGLCYLVSILKKYQESDSKANLQEYIKTHVGQLEATNPSIELSDNYRALRVAAYFGLIRMQSSGYNDAIITPTYNEVEKRCGGKFEDKEKYSEIIKRQIEKMYLSSDIDEAKDGVRRNFRLFPVMLLYKVLVELGRTTGEYKIDMEEYRYIIATTNVFQDYLDALLLVKLMRQEPESKNKFEEFRLKFDNRMIQALKQLDTLVVDKDSISLNKERIDEVTQKLFVFENNPKSFYGADYITFLCSTKALIDVDKKTTSEDAVDGVLSPVWFSKMAQQFTSADIESEQLYKDFRAKYGPEALKAVEGTDLLHKIFINETRDKENLCYVLEFDKQFTQFGGIGGWSSYKYGLYYNADKRSWMTGSARNPKLLSLAEAISLGTTIRNEILAGVKIIEDAGELTELKDYAELNTKLHEAMPTTINKKWVIKYFHMLFPQFFPPFYSDEWQNKVLTAIDEEPDGNTFIRMGQIALFVKKCGISTLAFSKVIYNLDSLGEIDYDEEPVITNEVCTFESEIKNGKNIVVYGTPGCGKSWYVQNEMLQPLYGVSNDEQHRIRTTFYQDYTNTDFIGQIIPKVKEDKSVTYEFNPGPFALALKMAIEHPNEPVALIIEELNRGNAASIFGDIFQLLDRTDDGKSQYRITNVNLQDYLNKVFKDCNIHFDYIVIPSNLYIVATMNTSDQNVFTLDTAFKRRWKFEKLPNIFTDKHEYAGYFVPGMEGITWKKLVKSINDYIVSRADELSSEDKQLGVYFIGKETLSKTQEGTTDATKKKEFAYKLLEYLWDDVAKYNHSDWFGPDVKTLDQLIEDYMTKGQEVFVDGILK